MGTHRNALFKSRRGKSEACFDGSGGNSAKAPFFMERRLLIATDVMRLFHGLNNCIRCCVKVGTAEGI